MLTRPRTLWILLIITLILAVVTFAHRVTFGTERQPENSPYPAVSTPTPAADISQSKAQPALSPALTATVPSTLSIAAAQDELAQQSPGNRFVQAVAQDVDTFNPVLTTNETSQLVARQLLPVLLGQDPQNGLVTPTELADRWEVTEGGRVYTFHLRNDIFWSDGQPVTAEDFRFTYAAIASETVQSPFRDSLGEIERIETPDDQTIIVTLRTPDCAALHLLRRPLLPSHLFATDLSDVRNHPFNEAPTVSAGPFLFGERMPGERIRLVRNPAYWKGAPQMDEWHFTIIADPRQQIEHLLAGEVNLAQIVPDQAAQVAADANSTPYAFPDNSFSFIALNLADPANPQPGRDANNAVVPQAPHPILGDQRVRQAIAHGVDSPQILNEIYHGYSFRLSSYILPTIEWAYAGDLAPYDLAPTNAATLLTAAGWLDTDGDGVRERNGQPLQLTLLTNDDSPQRIRIGELVQQQLAALGIAIQLEAVAFEAMTTALFDQRFDMAVIGWENLGPDPATSAFWHSQADVPGAGLNFVSFQDTEVDAWLDDAAQSTDCTPDQRAPLYRQVQQRVYAAVPYVFLGGPLQIWVSNSRWQTVRPQPWGLALAD